MADQNDGGPAFPVDTAGNMEDWRHGMSLRDYFAGQAMVMSAVMLAANGNAAGTGAAHIAKAVAEGSYIIADAMVKERDR